MNKIKKVIKGLSPELIKKYKEALKEGYKNEVCKKCGTVFLAHHHLIKCDLAANDQCPMVSKGSKSLVEKLFGPITGSIVNKIIKFSKKDI